MNGIGITRSRTPIALRRSVDVDSLCRANSCDRVICLGSFWPNSRMSFESHVVKSFKECVPTRDFEPHISALCRFYADLILDAVADEKFDWVVRVLSSAETKPEDFRPQSILADMLCDRTGARNAMHIFFKAESRPPMRNITRLAGPNALKSRIQYVVQDLFIKPADLGGSVLLVDDIFNTGASMRIYARVLKDHVGVQRIIGVNLAATRFHGGRDGHGILKLHTSRLANTDGLRQAWLDANGTFHLSKDCLAVYPPLSCEMLFVAERRGIACPACR